MTSSFQVITIYRPAHKLTEGKLIAVRGISKAGTKPAADNEQHPAFISNKQLGKLRESGALAGNRIYSLKITLLLFGPV